MNSCADYASFVALIDDDEHSTRLLNRTLVEQGARGVQRYGDALSAQMRLKAILADETALRPSMLVVDLKAHSGANLEFLISVEHVIAQAGIAVVVLAPELESAARNSLIEHGATAVFVRHGNRDAYRRVAADIVEFWAQTPRLEAVGM